MEWLTSWDTVYKRQYEWCRRWMVLLLGREKSTMFPWDALEMEMESDEVKGCGAGGLRCS